MHGDSRMMSFAEAASLLFVARHCATPAKECDIRSRLFANAKCNINSLAPALHTEGAGFS
jgi:hypothetical protein